MTYNLRPFIEAQPSKTNIKHVELDAIDLSLFQEGPEFLSQRQQLAAKLESSLSTYGFFSLINHGIDLETFDRLRSIAQSVL